ncbi:MAG: hypothetical protein GXP55_05360 [Deltaproteobacteria bacterium]|nr:hypothetical protein [Deltaproteobacteria bacterium]
MQTELVQTGRVKGGAVRQMLLWLEKEFDEARLSNLRRALEGHGHEDLNADLPAFGILSSRWYSASLFRAFCDELIRKLTRQEAQRLAKTAGNAALERSLGMFHRMLLRRIASPELHRRFAQRLWNAHFDTGRVDVELPAPGRSIVRYRQWTSHHRFMCDMCTASDIVIYGAMGLRDVEVKQLSCIDDGDDDCAHLVTWRI